MYATYKIRNLLLILFIWNINVITRTYYSFMPNRNAKYNVRENILW